MSLVFSATGIRDTSGFRADYTSILRENTGGIFSTGSVPSGYIILPPYFKELVMFGMCSAQCLEQVRMG